MPSNTRSHDEDGGVLGLIAGSGIMLMQAAAVIPGLLPVLLLTLPLVVPLVLLGIAAGVLVGVPLGLWRFGVFVVGLLRPPRASSGSARVNPLATDREVAHG